MTLESAYFIAQIIGGAAVVLSLVYVAVQIKQNTKATMMAATQTHQEMFARIEELMIADSSLAELVLRSAQAQAISDVDQWRLTLLYRNVLRTWQAGHFMHNTGVLDETIWETQASLLAGIIQQDRSFQAHFRRERPSLNRNFAEYLDGVLAKKVSFEAVPSGPMNAQLGAVAKQTGESAESNTPA